MSNPLQSPIPRTGNYPGVEELHLAQPSLPKSLLSWLNRFRNQVNDDLIRVKSFQKSQQLTGTDANLPAAGIPGRTYLATDTLKLYCDTGAAWHYASLT